MSVPRQKTIKLLRQTKGSALLEFAVVSGVLLLLVTAILDFGHAWFLRQTIINASREGARYAVVFRVDINGDRLPPSSFSPSVKDFTEGLLSQMLPSDSVYNASASGTGYTTGIAGQEVTVTAHVTKNWFAVATLMQLFGEGLTNPMVITATTTMRCE
jgi:hypothetical protein